MESMQSCWLVCKDEIRTCYVDPPLIVGTRTLSFFVQSKVVWGQERSSSWNLVNLITLNEKLEWTSYLVCRSTFTVNIRPLLFSVAVKVISGYQRSKSEHLVKTSTQKVCMNSRHEFKNIAGPLKLKLITVTITKTLKSCVQCYNKSRLKCVKEY